MLYIPISKNLPAMDGVLVVPSDRLVIYAQSTVSSNHPITPNQLKKVYTDLTSRDPDVFSGYTHILLFIVSDDIYDEFRVQRYRNVDGKNRTKKIGINVMQYVGKIIRR
ncbi:hypothetical protein PHYBOEH_001349 [Phytophthora boehmeriae]|uniref:Uncharacterized protein n=1 Tax=Phytophthora boehmeriae TaxID=109152 RepID=A0A8T1WU03_9STRA|nr:hypothetical protein PHYBOEH_001349 [Phytophthora boehmeriae]